MIEFSDLVAASSLEELGLLLQPLVLLFSLFFARCLGVFLSISQMRRFVGMPTCIGLAVATSLCLLGIMLAESEQTVSTVLRENTQSNSVLLYVGNCVVGMVIGIVPFLFLEVFTNSAKLVDAFRGARFTDYYDSQTSDRQSTLEHFGLLGGLLIFFIYGFHLKLLTFIYKSFEVLGPHLVELPSLLSQVYFHQQILRMTTDSIDKAILLVLPVLIVLFCFDLFNIFIARVVPPLPVFFEFLGVKMILGLVVLVFVISSSGNSLLAELFF